MSQPRRLSDILAWPLALFLAGVLGLVIALTGDGWRDAAAWAALSTSVLVVVWTTLTRRC